MTGKVSSTNLRLKSAISRRQHHQTSGEQTLQRAESNDSPVTRNCSKKNVANVLARSQEVKSARNQSSKAQSNAQTHSIMAKLQQMNRFQDAMVKQGEWGVSNKHLGLLSLHENQSQMDMVN